MGHPPSQSSGLGPRPLREGPPESLSRGVLAPDAAACIVSRDLAHPARALTRRGRAGGGTPGAVRGPACHLQATRRAWGRTAGCLGRWAPGARGHEQRCPRGPALCTCFQLGGNLKVASRRGSPFQGPTSPSTSTYSKTKNVAAWPPSQGRPPANFTNKRSHRCVPSRCPLGATWWESEGEQLHSERDVGTGRLGAAAYSCGSGGSKTRLRGARGSLISEVTTLGRACPSPMASPSPAASVGHLNVPLAHCCLSHTSPRPGAHSAHGTG